MVAATRNRASLMHKVPLQIRLTLWVVLIWTIVQVTLGLVLYLYERSNTDDFFNMRLQARSRAIVEEVRLRVPGLTEGELRALASDELNFVIFERFVLALYNNEGEALASTLQPSIDINALRTGLQRFSGTQVYQKGIQAGPADASSQNYRTTIVSFTGADGEVYHLLAATADTYARRMITATGRGILVTGLGGLAATAFAGWFLAGVAVAPMKRAAQRVREMTPQSVRSAVVTEEAGGDIDLIEFEAAEERIAQAFRAQDRFISNVSHEIKTPIATLLTESQTLGPLEELPEAVRDYVRSSREEMRKLGDLVESFLLLSRVEDERRTLPNMSSCLVNELIVDAMVDCDATARQYSVPIRLHLLDDPIGLGLTVYGVPDLLRTLLNNLIRNAIRFSPENKSVEVTASYTTETIRIDVRDYGHGIPEDIIDRIFDRFVQAPTEERRGRGHGLGLEIAQGIAELHKGKIAVENCSGGGCMFVITLPRIELNQSGVGGAPPDQEVQNHPDDGQQQNE